MPTPNVPMPAIANPTFAANRRLIGNPALLGGWKSGGARDVVRNLEDEPQHR
jgi:hypothetical protein